MWLGAMRTAAYLRRFMLTVCNDKIMTLHEAFFGWRPDLGHLRVYGCRVYVKINVQGDKLEAPSRMGVLVGFDDDITAGYHVFVPSARKVYRSADVTFDESLIPGVTSQQLGLVSKKSREAAQDVLEMQHELEIMRADAKYLDSVMQPMMEGREQIEGLQESIKEIKMSEIPTAKVMPGMDLQTPRKEESIIKTEYGGGTPIKVSRFMADASPVPMRDLSSATPIKFEEVAYKESPVRAPALETVSEVMPEHKDEDGSDVVQRAVRRAPRQYIPVTEGRSGRHITANKKYAALVMAADGEVLDGGIGEDYSAWDYDELVFGAVSEGDRITLPKGGRLPTLEDKAPKTYKEAMDGEFAWIWGPAFAKEMNNHQVVHNTWKLVKLPKGRKMAKSRWVLDYQFHGDVFIKAKARFVVCGYSQQEGVDYFETFSSTPRWDSVRLTLAISAMYGMGHDVDVSAAFLNAEMKEEVYVQQPPGFEVEYSNNDVWACLLLLSLYGTKQACANWSNLRNVKLMDVLGLTQSLHDSCVFYREGLNPLDADFLIHIVHVDDSITVGRDEARKKFLDEFATVFKCERATDNFFLGCEITKGKDYVKVDQTQYFKKLLETHNMKDCNPTRVPMDAGLALLKATNETEIMDNMRPAVGVLRYGCITRFDILTAVGIVSRHANRPTKEMAVAVKKIMRYIAGTLEYGLYYKRGDGVPNLHCYVDANFGGDVNDRKSTTGLAVYLNNCSHPVMASSGIQTTIATSTCHAEYMAAYKAVIYIIWCRGIMKEWGIVDVNATSVFEDNTSAIALAENPVNHKTTLHFAVKYYYVREQYKAGNIRLVQIGTEDQVADTLSKPLGRAMFEQSVTALAAADVKDVAVREIVD